MDSLKFNVPYVFTVVSARKQYSKRKKTNLSAEWLEITTTTPKTTKKLTLGVVFSAVVVISSHLALKLVFSFVILFARALLDPLHLVLL